MVVYELFYIVSATNEDIMSYVGDFKLEKEAEKLLDKLSLKVSRRIDDASYFIGFDPEVELQLKFNGTAIFRGRIKSSDKREFYEVETFSSGEILSRTMAKKIYENTTPEAIFSDLMTTYTDLTPVVSTSNTTISRFIANDYIDSIVAQLAQVLDWEIFTDPSKNIHFQPRGNTVNATTIQRDTTSSNAIFDKWKKNYNELCNYIQLTGDDITYSTQQSFTGNGSTDTYTIDNPPENIKITIDGVEQLQNSYEVFKDTREIHFLTVPGNNTSIIINYTYIYPIYVERQDATSIATYGTFTKKFKNKWIKTRSDGITYCNNYIEAFKDPQLSNTVRMNASYILTFNVGEQVNIVDNVEHVAVYFVVNGYHVINKIKLEYLKGYIEINIGSYIPNFSNIAGLLKYRIKELEEKQINTLLQLYSTNTLSVTATESIPNDVDHLNNRAVTNYTRCNHGRSLASDARIGLCRVSY